jgi:hypothetical protein
MNDWQTIETAPRDGNTFLGWNKTHGMHECAVPLGCENYKRLVAVYGSKAHHGIPVWFAPTHWMPLPEPPPIMKKTKS